MVKPPPPPLPRALAAMATLVARDGAAADRGQFRVHVSSFSGPSGARLLGRFCYSDELLHARVAQHLRDEEALDPDSVYAEIVHLPEGRIGNILARPVLRNAEIVYLGDSGATVERRIPASDLLVTVERDGIVLRSARTGVRVVPRLTSAHSVGLGVPVYRFLAMLQSQGSVEGGAWRWGALDALPYLPRVRAGRLVLALARWRVRPEELRALKAREGDALLDDVRVWREKRAIPRRVAVAEGDNALPVDLDTVLGAEILLQLIGSRDSAGVLQELFPGEDELCAFSPEGRFTHELVVPFVLAPEPAAPEAVATAGDRALVTTDSRPRVRRRFAPGSEWLYAKLYTGPAAADRVLQRLVAPLVATARASGWIDRWFFIRYSDPDWHLRVRFHGAPDALRQELLPALHEAAAPLLDDASGGALWRLQLDTYEREVERYGGDDGIVLSERLFEADSDAALEISRLAVGGLSRDDRWRVVLRGIDALFVDLGFDEGARRSLAGQMRDHYHQERRTDAAMGARLGEKFRAERKALQSLFDATGETADALAPPLRAALASLGRRSEKLAPIVDELRDRERAGRLSVSLTGLASSYAHMHGVRALRAAASAQELVLYDFLCRLYEARVRRRPPTT
jgi:thiopeptide-type bacteriocin biosynthesis protein